jgi:UDP-glucose 4-epimerase
VASLLMLWELALQYEETRDVAGIASEVVREAGAVTTRDQVQALRDYLRRNVTSTGAAHDNRPYFRATAMETLQSGRGYCGEVSRAFTCMAATVGISAHRLNLVGKDTHVVAEAELAPGTSVIVDCQSPPTIVDLMPIDEVMRTTGFTDYFTVNVRRLGINWLVSRLHLAYGPWDYALERPHVLKACGWGLLALGLIVTCVSRPAARRLRSTATRWVVGSRVTAVQEHDLHRTTSDPKPGFTRQTALPTRNNEGRYPMRVLITGGAGFIGSHLADAYIERGDEVFILDDLSTGSIDNIQHLRKHPRFHYTIDSVHKKPVVAELVDECDVVFHLAAAVGVKLIVESPVRTIETNVHGTEVVLAQAAKKKRKVLVASTSEVYGLSTQVPFREDGNLVLGATTNGRWSYACSKAIDEFLALAYWREKNVPMVIVRLFNTVGPRQTGRYGMVIPTFVKQALTGRPITVYGDGSQSRCFTYVGDVVGALIALMDLPEAVGEVFNIGSGEEVTIGELAEMVKVQTGSSSDIIQVPYEQAYGAGFEDMPRRVPDITKVGRAVGYRPSIDLEQILESVIAYQRQLLASDIGSHKSEVRSHVPVTSAV